MLGVISCHFNPCGYTTLRDNWWKWRKHMNDFNVPVVSVELSFDGVFHTDSEILINGIEYNVLWQKECLLNIACENLPPEVDNVAWIDADVVFYNSDWIEKTEKELKKNRLVQMFSQVNLSPDGEDWWPSSVRTGKVDPKGRPGHAWASKRDILQDLGFYPYCILGSGDIAMLNASCGIWKSDWFSGKKDQDIKTEWLKWGANWYQTIRGKVSFADNAISHMYHGSMGDRKYLRRYERLDVHDFCLSRDIVLDNQNLLSWTSESSVEMRRSIESYFFERREDHDA